jgi:predicted ATPase/DNA-binding SARP family transcriptional activator
MEHPCCVELFGGLRVIQGDRMITRFRTHKTGALFAFLAYHSDRMHSREVLVERFWPETSLIQGRTSLSVSLSSLRSQLEPPGVPVDSFLVADRQNVGVTAVVTTDVAAFEAALRSAARSADSAEQIACLKTAVELHRDTLLPGYYEDWIMPQQARLAEAHQHAMFRLTTLLKETGDLNEALTYAHRAALADPRSEAAARILMRLHLDVNDPGAALRQYEALEQALAEEGSRPSLETHRLIASLESRTGSAAPARSGEPSLRGGGIPLVGRASGVAKGTAERPTPVVSRLETSPSAPHPARHARLKDTVPATAPSREGLPRPLPVPLSTFFGREKELSRLATLLTSPTSRLITLTGPGGMGKTRLALEVLRTFAQESEVSPNAPRPCYVPLMDVTDSVTLRERLRESLGLPYITDDPQYVMEAIIAVLSTRKTVLLLDNAEHIADDCALLLNDLLERIEHLHCLVTSRLRLRIDGEIPFPVPPLPTPLLPEGSREVVPAEVKTETGIGELDDLSALLERWPAVALYVDRARHARPDFQITHRNADTIMRLVASLDGIPLAIELGAARTQAITPQQMLERMPERFDVLVTRRRITGGKHHSLRVTFQDSYALLSGYLKPFFVCLSVLRGWWSVEAAEAVTTSPNTLDWLMELADASLIRIEEQEESIRFSMLDTVRELAAAHLSSWEEAAAARRHRNYFLRLAMTAEQNWNGPEASLWLARMNAARENYHILLQRSHDRIAREATLDRQTVETVREMAVLNRLSDALQPYWEVSGRQREADQWRRTLLYLRDCLHAPLNDPNESNTTAHTPQRARFSDKRLSPALL